MEHLQHHLVSDHTSASVQAPFKCRWKSCEEFFCSRSNSKQVWQCCTCVNADVCRLKELTCVCVCVCVSPSLRGSWCTCRNMLRRKLIWSLRGQTLGAWPLNRRSCLFFHDPPILGGFSRRHEWRPATPSFMFSVGIQPQRNQERRYCCAVIFTFILKDKTQLPLFL